MRSATSCFNPTLYRKTMLRFWPLWGLYALIWLLVNPLTLLNSYFDMLRDTSYTETQTLRTMRALATRCEPDAQGRILLPQRLRQYAQLEKEVIIIGVFDRAEIWNAQRWTEIEEEALSSGSLEKAMQRMGL